MDKQSKGVILLVEDNKSLNDSNSRALRLRGYEVLTSLTLHEARGRLSEQEPDVILLDVMLPDGDGFDFCAEIEGCTTAHILFLTAKTDHEDRVRGLSLGGDDYIVKPFHPEELLARIDAVMRRRDMNAAKPSARTIILGSLTLDTFTGKATFGGEEIPLKTKEFAVLRLLAENAGSMFTADEIYKTVWGLDSIGDTRTVKVHISAVRKKLRMDSQCEIELEMEQRKYYVLRHNKQLS